MDVITDEELLNISILVLVLLKEKRKNKKKSTNLEDFGLEKFSKKEINMAYITI